MKINEVYRNNEYRGENSELGLYEKDRIRFQKKKLKGMYVGLYERFGDTFSVLLVSPADVKNNRSFIRPFVEIYLTKVEKFYATSHTLAHKSVQGTGLGFQLYLYILKELRLPLVSGDTQTVGGRTMWYKLWQYSQKDPLLSVYGWYPNKGRGEFVALQPSEENPGELEAEDGPPIYIIPWDIDPNDELENLYDEREYLDDMRIDILKKYNFNYSREFKQEAKPITDKLKKLEAQIKKLEYKQDRDNRYAGRARIVAVYDPKTKPKTEIG